MSFLGLAFLGLHNVFGWIMTLTNAAAGVWSTAAHWKEQLRRRELWYLVTVAQVAVAIQVLLGVLVLQADGLEVQQLHVVYGFVSLAAVGILYSYRQQIMQWQYLLYGGGCLFLMGMGLREMVLGSV